MKPLVSIIIVHYKVKKELVDCLYSIYTSLPKVKFEIIVVDNDERKTIEEDLKEQFPKVEYVKSKKNLGFGAGNNLGAGKAHGEYLFFLNPDTKVFKNTIDPLFNFISKRKNTAAVAPLLLDKNNNPYPLQGSKELTPIRAIFAHSFINRLFPKNPVAKKFWLLENDKKSAKEAEVLPGTAFIIRSDIFKKIGGFDENIFLFFEENDLFNKIKRLGFKNYIIRKSRVFHAWGASTKKKEDIDKIFSSSRFYYFRKWYGFIPAVAVEIVTSFNMIHLLLTFILLISLFLRVYKLNQLMVFIGDQGWFYLSARDMLLTGKITLVGITASHVWLHQGPFWTYILALLFWVFKFNPVAPAYFTALLDAGATFLIYKLGREMFNKNVGLFSSLFYAVSPLVVFNARMPYHTSLISFFTILFLWSLYKWIKGNTQFFILTVFFLAVLYNFELATQVLWFVVFFAFFLGFWEKKEWARKIFNLKTIGLSIIAFLIPMFPIILYDISHGFKQTIVFAVWIGFRVLTFFGRGKGLGISLSSIRNVVFSIVLNFEKLVFPQNRLVVLAFGFLVVASMIWIIRTKRRESVILPVSFAIPLFGIFLNRQLSDAYIPIFFPTIALLTGYGITVLLDQRNTLVKLLIIILFAGLFFINGWFIIKNDFWIAKGYSMQDRISAAQEIVRKSKGREYNLIGKGPGSRFASFTMNYEYLTWTLGHSPVKRNAPLKITVWEKPQGIIISE